MAKRRRKTSTRTTTKRKCGTTNKSTQFSLEAFNKASNIIAKNIDDAIARQKRIDYVMDMGRSIGRGINWILGRRFNTKSTMEKVKDMKIKLLKNNVKKTNPIFTNMKELKALIRDIDWARKSGNRDMEDYNIMQAKRVIEKINKKYNKLMKN